MCCHTKEIKNVVYKSHGIEIKLDKRAVHHNMDLSRMSGIAPIPAANIDMDLVMDISWFLEKDGNHTDVDKSSQSSWENEFDTKSNYEWDYMEPGNLTFQFPQQINNMAKVVTYPSKKVNLFY